MAKPVFKARSGNISAAVWQAVAVKLLSYDPFATKKETDDIPGSDKLPGEDLPF